MYQKSVTHRFFQVLFGLIVFTLVTSTVFGQTPLSSFFRDGVPDFEQRKAGRAGGGNNHCAPTVAANSLTWFDNSGFDIAPDAWTDTPIMMAKHDGLIDQLATDVMTSGANGTSRDDYVKGLRKYLRRANNNSLFQFDVKFQGSGYRGYTVGKQGDTATLNFLENEISTGEDVMLHIGWFTETAAGTLSARQGGHVVTLDGYTSDNKLLIRDPFFPEGIIEPDFSFAAGDLIYEYSTTGNANLRAKIEGITSVSPKPFLFFDGLVDASEYFLPL